MTTNTLNRINRLSAERSMLYRLASNGHRGDVKVRQHIAELNRELDSLWETRRQERAGILEGVDLLVHRSYERVYGSDFDEAVAPLRSAPSQDEAATIAA